MKYVEGPTFIPTKSGTYKLLKHDERKGILYYQGGWWMSEATAYELEHDRFQRDYNPKYNDELIVTPRPNKETMEIELDRYLLPKI
jgi:hypothetical protein